MKNGKDSRVSCDIHVLESPERKERGIKGRQMNGWKWRRKTEGEERHTSFMYSAMGHINDVKKLHNYRASQYTSLLIQNQHYSFNEHQIVR